MRAESERAFQEGGEIRPPDKPALKSFEEMKGRSRRRIVGTKGSVSRVMLPSGEMGFVNAEGKIVEGASAATQTPMAKWELNRLAKEVDRDELEMLAQQRSLEAGGEGGRIEVYAGGAMEWVPNGPGGIPQPTTGDVFFDPIAEEQRKMQSDVNMKQLMQSMISQGLVKKPSAADLRLLRGGEKKFARGGVVKKYQVGGLAQANLDDDEDEIFDPASVTGVDEMIASAMPDPAPDLRKMATMTRDTALQQLRAGQNEFQQRQAKQQKRAEQDRWFALAQGMLAPTQTGGFGENIGMAAGALREQSAQQTLIEEKQAATQQKFAEREAEIAGDYYDALENLSGFKQTSRARVVGTKTVMHPEDRINVDAGKMHEADARRVVASIVMMPDGSTVNRIERDRYGEALIEMDPRKDPGQAAAIEHAKLLGREMGKSQFDIARTGLRAMPTINRMQEAYTLLGTLSEDTSGLMEAMRRVATFAGITEVIDENTTLSRIHRLFGDKVLDDLHLLTGTKTDFEYKKMEELNASLGKDVESNLGIIDDQMTRLYEMVDKGEHAAQSLSEGPGIEERDFMLEQYTRWRKKQAEAAMEYDAATRTAPPSKEDALIQNIQNAGGNKAEIDFHIGAFEEFYDLSEETRLALRELGADI